MFEREHIDEAGAKRKAYAGEYLRAMHGLRCLPRDAYTGPSGHGKTGCFGMIQSKPDSQATVLEVTDPQWIARHRKQDERHKRNLQWLQAHWTDLPHSRGRYVAVANQRAFVADTAELAWEWARSQHPDDDGAVVLFVPREKGWRVYAHRR